MSMHKVMDITVLSRLHQGGETKNWWSCCWREEPMLMPKAAIMTLLSRSLVLKANTEMVQLLLKAGADLNAQSGWFGNVL